jgi:conjugal transfer pilus assembly protein TraV
MITKGWILLIPLVGLAGCSAKYGCKGMPDDPVCMSAVEAYKATDHAPSKPKSADNGAAPANATPTVSAKGSTSETVPTPKIEDPTPIRTPSQIMRIWIAPWEDDDGDLNVSGYVYTELEPRRWMIGKPATPLNASILPLQVLHRERPVERKNAVAGEKDRETPILPLYGNPEASDH